MKIKLLLILLLISSIHAKEHHNHLFLETSPYLMQHVTNPVDWYPWSKEAFDIAKKENKPIFLSIGYSTCHWCHVMKRESFENETIAELLNKNFISIKVDREEMPHIDAYYQELHTKIKGRSGGWPLSVFMTPKREIFYITGYIPPQKESYSEGFINIIESLSKLYDDKKALKKRITEIEEKIQTKEKHIVREDPTLDTLVEKIKESYDDIYSGFGASRKFPEAVKLSLMLDLAQLSEDEELYEFFYEMLDVMALRGLYDHVEGGFFRYSVDAVWEIPHFEKMLYNQAELIKLYTKAYLLSGKELYKKVVVETIDMLDERFEKDNLYYSASDAESDEEEGAYFVFSSAEIEGALKGLGDKDEIKELINFTKDGNFDAKTHINLFSDKRVTGLKTFLERLKKIRDSREYPFIDKKINTAWNAMMIDALYSASLINEHYISKADKHLQALKEMMFRRGELYHQGIIGVDVKQKGFLEDYSFLISALISGYEVTYDEEKLAFGEYLLNSAKQKFYRDYTWYLNAKGVQVEGGLKDKYYKSALSNMIQNYLKFASLKASFRYEKLALQSLKNLESKYRLKTIEAPSLATAYLMQKYGIVTLKSSKKNLLDNSLILHKTNYPYLLLEDKPYDDFLACTLRRCFAKEKDVKKIKERIEAFKGEK